MTPSGKKGKKGHIARDGDRSRSRCGRRLGGGFFTDPASKPEVCARCATSYEKSCGVDHHHLIYKDGKWWVAVPARSYIYFAGSAFAGTWTMRCGVDGCDRMVPQPVYAMQTYNGNLTCGNSPTAWTWGWAA